MLACLLLRKRASENVISIQFRCKTQLVVAVLFKTLLWALQRKQHKIWNFICSISVLKVFLDEHSRAILIFHHELHDFLRTSSNLLIAFFLSCEVFSSHHVSGLMVRAVRSSYFMLMSVKFQQSSNKLTYFDPIS